MEYSKEMNIWERMAAISAEIKSVEKRQEVGFGNNKYKAAVEADVLKPVKEAEAKFRVFSYPADHEIVSQGELGAGGEKAKQFIRIKVKYVFVNLDSPEQVVSVVSYGDGVDSLDKAPGKAMTYADKYALMKAYKMVTGDDPDQNASDDLEGHDIWKIQERVQRLLTSKMKNGMSEEELISAMGMTAKEFRICTNSFNNVAALEAKLRKV